MTNTTSFVVATIALIASSASAQCNERKTPQQIATARAERHVQSTMSSAFNGITLSAAQEGAAREIITEALDAMRALGPAASVRPQLNERIKTRDAGLEALLASRTDSAKFEENTKEHVYRSSFVLDCGSAPGGR